MAFFSCHILLNFAKFWHASFAKNVNQFNFYAMERQILIVPLIELVVPALETFSRQTPTFYMEKFFIRHRYIPCLLLFMLILISNQTGQAMTENTLKGGSGNFAANRERAAEAGRKGGHISGGNFRNDPERAREAGRKGGQISRRGKSSPPIAP